MVLLCVLHTLQSPLFLAIKHPRSPTCRIAYNQNLVNQYLPPITRSIFRGLRHNLSQHLSPPINCLSSFHHPSSFSLSYRLSFLGYLFPLPGVTRSITPRTQDAAPPPPRPSPSSSHPFSDFMFFRVTFVFIISLCARPTGIRNVCFTCSPFPPPINPSSLPHTSLGVGRGA